MACDRFERAMDDDFNTPAALGALFDLSRELYRHRDAGPASERSADGLRAAAGVLVALGASLGLFPPREKTTGRSADVDSAVERLVGEREEARRRRDWKRADQIREEALALGASIEDTPAGPRVRWKSA
jgi:cysteinyl-tRNA synthetase